MLKPQGENQQTAMVLLALILVVGIFYLLFTLALKLFGVALLLVGAWLFIIFPDIERYQTGKFVYTAQMIGLLFIIIGLAIAIFG